MAKCPQEDLGGSDNECIIQNVTASRASRSDPASRMSSLLLYNYLLTFADSDSCGSLKKGFENITIMQLPRNRA